MILKYSFITNIFTFSRKCCHQFEKRELCEWTKCNAWTIVILTIFSMYLTNVKYNRNSPTIIYSPSLIQWLFLKVSNIGSNLLQPAFEQLTGSYMTLAIFLIRTNVGHRCQVLLGSKLKWLGAAQKNIVEGSNVVKVIDTTGASWYEMLWDLLREMS